LEQTGDVLDGTSAEVIGQTFTLTTGTDNFSPTATVAANKTTSGNDTFEATGKTFTALDYIDAGEGTDKIIIKDADGVMNTAVPSGITLKSVESMEIQTAGSLGVAAVTGQPAQAAVKEVDSWTLPDAALNVVTLAAIANGPDDGDEITISDGGTGNAAMTYVAASTSWTVGTTTGLSLAEAVAAALNAIDADNQAFVADGKVYTKTDISGYGFNLTNTAGDSDITNTFTVGTDADGLVADGKFSVTYNGVTLVTAGLDTTPTKAEALTLVLMLSTLSLVSPSPISSVTPWS